LRYRNCAFITLKKNGKNDHYLASAVYAYAFLFRESYTSSRIRIF